MSFAGITAPLSVQLDLIGDRVAETREESTTF